MPGNMASPGERVGSYNSAFVPAGTLKNGFGCMFTLRSRHPGGSLRRRAYLQTNSDK